jgi:type VI secretion system secreted protein Hcp
MKTIMSNLRPLLGWAAVLGILVVPVFTVTGAVDMFLKVGSIKGESTDKQYPGGNGWINVLAWSWGASNSGTTHTGGGAGAGIANVQDLSVTKYVDIASPDLFMSTLKGTHFPDAQLIVRRVGQNPIAYIKLEMKEVLVTSLSTGASGGDDRLTENVSLNFASFTFTYTPQNPDGSAGTAKNISWDIAGNVAQ